MIVDDKFVIFGLPASIGEKEPTRYGYKIPSRSLALILKEEFEKRIKEAKDYNSFLKEVIKKLKKDKPAITNEVIAEYLDLSIEEIKKVSN